MSVSKTIKSLEQKKKHLARTFSAIVFLILFLLQVFFFLFKYVEYHRNVSSKLENDYKMITLMKNIGIDLRNDCQNNYFCIAENSIKERINLGSFVKEPGKRNKFKPSDFIIYNTKIEKIIFSNNSEEEFNLDLVKDKGDYGVYKRGLWENDYYILRKNLKQDIDVFIYTEGNMNIYSILLDLGKFFILSLMFSWLIYILMNNFINNLFKPIEENIEEMQDFVHNVGHELKTPLANMKSSLELGKLKNDFTESIKESFSQLEKMNNLIETLLSLSTLDKEKIENIEVFSIIEEELKKYSSNIEEKFLNVSIEKKYNLKLNTNKEHFKILFSNLLSNAIKYNIENGNINITISEKFISIVDSGIGIEEKNKERIFEKFFREEFARNEEGLGIGLSLVKKITGLYKWKIEVKSKKDEGTKIIIRF